MINIIGWAIIGLWLVSGYIAHTMVERKHNTRATEVLLLGIIMGPLTFLALRD